MPRRAPSLSLTEPLSLTPLRIAALASSFTGHLLSTARESSQSPAARCIDFVDAMEVTTGNQLLDPNLYPQNHPSLPTDLEANFDQNSFGAYALNNLANASVNHQQTLGQNDLYNQSSQHPQLRLQRTRFQPRPDGSPTTQSPYAQSHHSASPQNHDDPYGIPNRLHFSPNTTLQNGSPQQPLYMPIQRLQQGQQNTPGISPTSTSPQHATPTNEDGTKSHFAGMQIVKDPPHLGEWRERLFNIQGTVTMTEQEFQIYFPHIDNVYSHRSTQKYKRRPFVSHYWDCRLKGRPSGTPKSDDPNKKKRKRTARERDLCDVKIKITEYFPTTSDWQGTPNGSNGGHSADGSNLTFISENQSQQQDSLSDSAQPFGVLAPPSTLPPGHPGANGARYYTIQMVNGNISGNDTNSPADSGPACMHKHSLLDSDKIKKNSVQRHFLKEEKEAKRMSSIVTTNTNPNPASSPPKRKPGTASGPASITKNLHALVPSALPGGPLILFANSYCPFAQRIWIALEIKRLPYQYVEVIPAHMQGGTVERPQELLEICPEGIVPCLKHGKWGIWESGVCLEYLEDLTSEAAGMNRLEAHAAENWLLPPGDARLKAWSRLWVDHVRPFILSLTRSC